jgi:hypothetical protein
MRWEGHVASMREIRNVYKIFFGKPEGKRSLGRHKREREDNIKIGRREIV